MSRSFMSDCPKCSASAELLKAKKNTLCRSRNLLTKILWTLDSSFVTKQSKRGIFAKTSRSHHITYYLHVAYMPEDSRAIPRWRTSAAVSAGFSFITDGESLRAPELQGEKKFLTEGSIQKEHNYSHYCSAEYQEPDLPF